MKYSEICETRLPDIEYQADDKQVVAILKSYKSQVYTKLAQQLQRVSELEAELKASKEEVKQLVRDNVTDLFDAEDAVRTRKVETVSFIMTLSKDPKASETPKYKDILEALAEHMTPELIAIMEGLKKQMVTVTQKAPSLKIEPIAEGVIGNLFARIKAFVFNWGAKYDQKLAALKAQAGLV